jgi:hypothetical protein
MWRKIEEKTSNISREIESTDIRAGNKTRGCLGPNTNVGQVKNKHDFNKVECGLGFHTQKDPCIS